MQELIPHVCIIPKVISLELFLYQPLFQKYQEGLYIVNLVVRILLTRKPNSLQRAWYNARGIVNDATRIVELIMQLAAAW